MNESMLDRLKTMENRYEELGHMLMDPDIGSDIKKMTEVTKEQASLQAAYDLYQEYKEIEAGIEDAKELAKESDPEIKEMAKLDVPVIAVITGEGCSGGALGLAVANKVLILEHAYYTVISPEGCASILWRDAAEAKTAAQALKITGDDLLKFDIVDEVVKEPVGGAHYDIELMAKNLKESLLKALDEYKNMTPDELKEDRYSKFRRMGVFAE